MNKDNRTSNLTEATKLISDTEVPAHAVIHDNPNLDKEALFLLARSGSHNEKITYGNLKDSIISSFCFSVIHNAGNSNVGSVVSIPSKGGLSSKTKTIYLFG